MHDAGGTKQRSRNDRSEGNRPRARSSRLVEEHMNKSGYIGNLSYTYARSRQDESHEQTNGV